MKEILNSQGEIVAFVARVHDVVLYDVYRVPANGSFDSRGTLHHVGVFSEAAGGPNHPVGCATAALPTCAGVGTAAPRAKSRAQ